MTDDIASENDVRDEIDIEETSARCTYALVVADPDCQGPRPSTQASERVIGVDEGPLRGLARPRRAGTFGNLLVTSY